MKNEIFATHPGTYCFSESNSSSLFHFYYFAFIFLFFHFFIFYYAFSFLRMSNPSRTIRCNSSFEESTNSAMAKSSGATS